MKRQPVIWRCPGCGLAVELFVAVRRPPSHPCPARRGRETVFAVDEKEPTA